MKKYLFFLLPLVFLFPLASCKKETEQPKPNPPQIATTPAQIFTYEIINTWPHDTGAFTQGLQFVDGELYESTGLKGKSSLRRVELNTGKVLQKIDVPPEYFAEGMTVFQGKIYQLTYQEHTGFIYDQKTFTKIGSWQYEGEGWGLTNDGTNLIMSNGSNKIMYIDPQKLTVVKTIEVKDEGFLVEDINELEYIKGQIYANIWQKDIIVIIDPATGNVTGRIELGGLLSPMERTERIDVLNGIAADNRVLNGIATDDKEIRLFVTGKLWPKLFEIKIRRKELAFQ